MTEQDRRRYYRINDWVGLSYRLLDEQDLKLYGEADTVQISSVQILASIQKELSGALNMLWQSNPQTATVIGLMNKKLDFIISEMGLDHLENGVLQHESTRANVSAGVLQHESTRVNISACGMAFECDEQFNSGQMLELNLLLKPEKTKLKLQGCVTACDRADDDSKKYYVLRVDFVDTETEVQAELFQLMFSRQSIPRSEQRRGRTQ